MKAEILAVGKELLLGDIINTIDKQTNPTVAPYAKENEVTLRITAKAPTKAEAERIIAPVEKQIYSRPGEDIYVQGNTTLEDVVAKILIDKKLTISTAESCTGGLLAGRLINYPGISSVFMEGAVTYSNEAKMNRLGVRRETLEAYGAVSSQTAKEMAEGIARTSNTDIGVSITGIAGPEGGTEEKPVGLVYIGLYIKGDIKVRQFNFTGDRQKIRNRTVTSALDWLRRELTTDR